MLPLRPFGNTGLHLAPLCLGTVKIGRNQQVKYPTPFDIPDDNAVRELLACAKGLGINCLDTAPAYGISEERLGRLLGKQAQEWLICTKVGEEFINGASHFDFTPEHTRASVERSLKRLCRDYLDIVLIHSDGNDLDILQHYGTLEALLALKQKGLIRAVGMSTKTVEGAIAVLQQADAAMITYNLCEKTEKPALDYAHQHNKGIFIKKGFASGHFLQQGGQPGEDPIESALRFVLSHPGASAVTVGTINPAHLIQNAKSAEKVLKTLE